MRNQFLQQVSKISKKTKRAIALGLAAIVTVMSVNPMQAVAAGEVVKPTVNTSTGAFEYNAGDLFGMATHVHLFGRTVTTTVHTHGNVVANTANLSGGVGMHNNGDKITIDNYHEWSVITGSFTNGGNNECDFTLGLPVPANFSCSGTVVQATSEGNTANINAINATFTTLEGLSKKMSNGEAFGGMSVASNPTLSWNFAGNGRYIETDQVAHVDEIVYINITAADLMNDKDKGLAIRGLDTTTTNRGIVVINVDMSGYTSANFETQGSGIIGYNGAQAIATGEHSTSAFGSCRLLWNFYDSSAADHLYTGSITFGTTTMHGTILAPKADVTVGAINGNVMANSVTHTNGESHRLDIVPLTPYVQAGSAEVESVILNLDMVGDDESILSNGASSDTKYKVVYIDSNSTEIIEIDEIEATWTESSNSYQVIINGRTTAPNDFPAGEYYFQKIAVHAGYDNGTEEMAERYYFHVNQYGHVTYKNTNTLTGAVSYTTTPLIDYLYQSNVPITDGTSLELTFGSTPTDAEVQSIKYNVYNTNDEANPVISNISVTENGGTYTVEVDSTMANANLTVGQSYYLQRVDTPTNWSTADGYDNRYVFNVGANGTITEVSTMQDRIVTNSVVSVPITEGTALELIFGSTPTDAEVQSIRYNVYNTNDEVNPVISNIPVTENGGNYTVTVTQQQANTLLAVGQSYYLQRVDTPTNWSTADGYDNRYVFNVEANGTITEVSTMQDKIITSSNNVNNNSGSNNSGSNNSGSNNSGSNNSGSNNSGSNNSGSNNSGSNNSNTTNTTNTTNTNTTTTPSENGVPVTTDGSAAGGDATVTTGGSADGSATGGDATATGGGDASATDGDSDMMTSADTGEFNAGGVFAGYVGILVMAAVVYMVAKKKEQN